MTRCAGGSACRKPTAAGSSRGNNPCRGNPSADDLYRLQQRLQNGEDVCPELANRKGIQYAPGATIAFEQRGTA
jgi:hypothetical protein